MVLRFERYLTAADNWQHTFSNPIQYNNGALINYTITEDGYTTQITGDAQLCSNQHQHEDSRHSGHLKVWENRKAIQLRLFCVVMVSS